jgi:triacylglycerol lipase
LASPCPLSRNGWTEADTVDFGRGWWAAVGAADLADNGSASHQPMSGPTLAAVSLPALPSPLIAALGRPVWNEARAPGERARLAANPVELRPGHGQRVVLVTGYMAGSASAAALSSWLERAGYQVYIAGVGRNASTSSSAAELIGQALLAGAAPSILVGHSRGGQQCRVVAQRHPELVSQLITLAGPVRVHLPRQIVLRVSIEALRLMSHLPVGPNDDPVADSEYEAELLSPFAVNVPWTSIWSKIDGIIEWQACLDEQATSLEVRCSHAGMLGSVPSFRAIASVLNSHVTRRVTA